MTKSKLGRWQGRAAEKYYREHPDASINMVANALKINERTVARARKKLVAEGILQPGRNAPLQLVKPEVDHMIESPVLQPPEPLKIAGRVVPPKTPMKAGDTLLDHEAMKTLAGMVDQLAQEEDDDITRKKMLIEIKRIFFDPKLHPDTRMSASQVWIKLKDMSRSRELGPGKPMIEDVAIQRMVDLMRAFGATLTIKALYRAFNLEEPNEQTKAQQAPPAGDPPQDTSPARHEDSKAPVTTLRFLQLEGGDGLTRSPINQGPDDLSGPSP